MPPVQAPRDCGSDAAVWRPPAPAHRPPEQVHPCRGGRQRRGAGRRPPGPLRPLAGVQHVPGPADPRPPASQPGPRVCVSAPIARGIFPVHECCSLSADTLYGS